MKVLGLKYNKFQMMISQLLMKIYSERSSDHMQNNKHNKKQQKEENKTKYTLILRNHSNKNHNVIS